MHLLSIMSLKKEDINEIFKIADKLRNYEDLPLEGKRFVIFFPENSIRTRITFEEGIKSLGGNCVLFSPETLNKREAYRDVVGYINNWCDGIIVRHKSYEKIQDLAEFSEIPIINAMTSYNHPCEILSDIYAIKTLNRKLEELTFTFVGEEGNIFYSWLHASEVLDFKLKHVYKSKIAVFNKYKNYFHFDNIKEAFADTDVVLTDPLHSSHRNELYYRRFQVTLERMKLTNDNSILNPCPPFFRHEEVSEDAINSDYFVGYEFKKDLMLVQQAIIIYCLGIDIWN